MTSYLWPHRLAKCGWGEQAPPDTFILVSYVFIYCTNTRTAAMLRSLLSEGGVRACLVAERGQRNDMNVIVEGQGT